MNDLEKLTKVVKVSSQNYDKEVLTSFGHSFNESTQFIATGGNIAVYPENSRIAFKTVTRHWGIQTTIQLTADGKWYCFHDSTIDRMTNGTGKFMDKTSAQIDALRLDAGNGVAALPDELKKVPSLDQYLQDCIFARKVPVIEISSLKTDYTDSQLDSLVSIIRNMGLDTRVLISCSTLSILTKMRNKMPFAVMHYLVSADSTDVFNACVQYNLFPSFINTSTALTPTTIFEYHVTGLSIGVRGATLEEQTRFSNLGIDFISVDTPNGNLRYDEPVLLNGFIANNGDYSGPSFVEECSKGTIHLRINVRNGNNTVGTRILKLPDWAIPRWSNTLVGQVRATKVASHTFMPASIDIWGYAATQQTENAQNFGYVTVGTNWEQRATYATMDFIYSV